MQLAGHIFSAALIMLAVIVRHLMSNEYGPENCVCSRLPRRCRGLIFIHESTLTPPMPVPARGFFCFLLHDLLKSPACHSHENQQAPIRNQETRAHGFRWQIALLDQSSRFQAVLPEVLLARS